MQRTRAIEHVAFTEVRLEDALQALGRADVHHERLCLPDHLRIRVHAPHRRHPTLTLCSLLGVMGGNHLLFAG